MDFCFDTSGINRLHDDPDREPLIAGLFISGRVLISAPNVIEAAITECRERRVSLIQLMNRLARNMRPLRIPTELLRELTAVRSSGKGPTTLNVDVDDGVWAMLSEPELADEGARQEAFRWKEGLEKPFVEAHRLARPDFNKLFAPGDRPTSFGSLLRLYCENPESHLGSASNLFQSLTGQTLTIDTMRSLFAELPQWPLYLGGWAQGIYAQAIQPENFSPKKNAGTIDLWCAIYLEHCDAMVTNDHAQYDALRVLNVLTRREPRAKVLSYEQFRDRYIIAA